MWIIIAVWIAIVMDLAFVWFRRYRRLSRNKSIQNGSFQDSIQKSHQFLSSIFQDVSKKHLWFYLRGIFSAETASLGRGLAVPAEGRGDVGKTDLTVGHRRRREKPSTGQEIYYFEYHKLALHSE